jgi:glucosamine 6-phosphate synthetase-like amidotransferase/phosphosugar isomerase protein
MHGPTVLTANVHAGIPTPVLTTSSLTATSVTISWTQVEFSLPVTESTVSLRRVTGSGQVLCPGVEHTMPAITTSGNSASLTGLEEFSAYLVSVTAAFNVSSSMHTSESNTSFTTPSAGTCNYFTEVVILYYALILYSSHRDSTQCDSHHNLQKHHGDLGHYRVH